PSDVVLGTTLAYGDTNANTKGDVSKLQWFLYQEKYLDPYALSGVFDTQTQTAVINFQTANGLLDPANPNNEAVGVVGPQTRALIHQESVAMDPDAAPAVPLARWQVALEGIEHAVRFVVLTVYINIFPVIRGTLVLMISVTLVLVVARMLGLVILLLIRAAIERSKHALGEAVVQGVSILIPAYNEQENIAATVES